MLANIDVGNRVFQIYEKKTISSGAAAAHQRQHLQMMLMVRYMRLPYHVQVYCLFGIIEEGNGKDAAATPSPKFV